VWREQRRRVLCSRSAGGRVLIVICSCSPAAVTTWPDGAPQGHPASRDSWTVLSGSVPYAAVRPSSGR
jgi:hypothetical protein